MGWSFAEKSLTAQETCSQITEEQKAKIDKMVNELKEINTRVVASLWKDLGHPGDSIDTFMIYYAEQYKILNNVLAELTGGVCANSNARFQMLKSKLIAEYAEHCNKSTNEESSIVCLSEFKEGLLNAATMIQILLNGESFEDYFNEALVLMGVKSAEQVKEEF